MTDRKDQRLRDLVTPAEARELRYAFKRGVAFAMKLGLPNGPAEDTVLEAVFKAYKERHRYQPRPGATFSSWFRRIVLNLVRDAARHNEVAVRHRENAKVALTPTDFPRADIVLSNVAAGENRRRLMEALPTATTDFLKVLVLQNAKRITRDEARTSLGMSMTEYEAAKKRHKRQVRATMNALGLVEDDVLSSELPATGWNGGRGAEEEET